MSKYKFLLILGSPPHTWRIHKIAVNRNLLVRDHLHIRGKYTKRSLIIEPFLIL